MKSITLLIISILFTVSLYSQDSTFLLINYHGRAKVLDYKNYSHHSPTFKLDTSKQNELGGYFVSIIRQGEIVQQYRFKDSSAYPFGSHIESELKPVNYNHFKWDYVEYSVAKAVADSLRNEGVMYVVEPPINSEYRYELRVWAEIDYSAYNYDTSLVDQLIYSGKIKNINHLFPEQKKGISAIRDWKRSPKNGVILHLLLKKKEFDFDKLKRLNYTFDEKKLAVKELRYFISVVE